MYSNIQHNEHKLGQLCEETKVTKDLKDELIFNLKLSHDSILNCYKTVHSATNQSKCDSSDINLSWLCTFSNIWKSKVHLNEVKTATDLERLIIMFRTCVLQVSRMLRGLVINAPASAVSRHRLLQSHLACLDEPLLLFLRCFVAMATHLQCISDHLLDLLSDLTSVYLEQQVLLMRWMLHNSPVVVNQTSELFSKMDDIFLLVFPDSVEPRLDTCLKITALNKSVAGPVAPLLRHVLDNCRRLQNKLHTITFAAYAKFVLLYARAYKLFRQAHLDAELILEQARFLSPPRPSRETSHAYEQLCSLLLTSRPALDLRSNTRKLIERHILNVNSVTDMYNKLRALPSGDLKLQIPTEYVMKRKRISLVGTKKLKRSKILAMTCPRIKEEPQDKHLEVHSLQSNQQTKPSYVSSSGPLSTSLSPEQEGRAFLSVGHLLSKGCEKSDVCSRNPQTLVVNTFPKPAPLERLLYPVKTDALGLFHTKVESNGMTCLSDDLQKLNFGRKISTPTSQDHCDLSLFECKKHQEVEIEDNITNASQKHSEVNNLHFVTSESYALEFSMTSPKFNVIPTTSRANKGTDELVTHDSRVFLGQDQVITHDSAVIEETQESTVTEETELITPDSAVIEETKELVTDDSVITEETDELVTHNSGVIVEKNELVTDDSVITEETGKLLTHISTVIEETHNLGVIEEKNELSTHDSAVFEDTNKLIIDDSVDTEETDELGAHDSAVNEETHELPVLEETHELVTHDSAVLEETHVSQVIGERDQLLSDDSVVTEETDQLVTHDSEVIKDTDELLTHDSAVIEETNELVTHDSQVIKEMNEIVTHDSADIEATYNLAVEDTHESQAIEQTDELMTHDSAVIEERYELITDDVAVIEETYNSPVIEELITKDSRVMKYQNEMVTHDSAVFEETDESPVFEHRNELITHDSSVFQEAVELITHDSSVVHEKDELGKHSSSITQDYYELVTDDLEVLEENFELFSDISEVGEETVNSKVFQRIDESEDVVDSYEISTKIQNIIESYNIELYAADPCVVNSNKISVQSVTTIETSMSYKIVDSSKMLSTDICKILCDPSELNVMYTSDAEDCFSTKYPSTMLNSIELNSDVLVYSVPSDNGITHVSINKNLNDMKHIDSAKENALISVISRSENRCSATDLSNKSINIPKTSDGTGVSPTLDTPVRENPKDINLNESLVKNALISVTTESHNSSHTSDLSNMSVSIPKTSDNTEIYAVVSENSKDINLNDSLMKNDLISVTSESDKSLYGSDLSMSVSIPMTNDNTEISRVAAGENAININLNDTLVENASMPVLSQSQDSFSATDLSKKSTSIRMNSDGTGVSYVGVCENSKDINQNDYLLKNAFESVSTESDNRSNVSDLPNISTSIPKTSDSTEKSCVAVSETSNDMNQNNCLLENTCASISPETDSSSSASDISNISSPIPLNFDNSGVTFVGDCKDSIPITGYDIEKTIDLFTRGEKLIVYREFETMYNCVPDLRLFLQRLETKMKQPSINIYKIVDIEDRSYRNVLSSFVMDGDRNLENETWYSLMYFGDGNQKSSKEFTLHQITSFFYFHNYLNQMRSYHSIMRMCNRRFTTPWYMSYKPHCKCNHCLANTNRLEENCINFYIFYKDHVLPEPMLRVKRYVEQEIKCFENESPQSFARYLSAAKEMQERARLIARKKMSPGGDKIQEQFLQYCVQFFWEVFIGHSLEAEHLPVSSCDAAAHPDAIRTAEPSGVSPPLVSSTNLTPASAAETGSPSVKKKEKFKPLKKRKLHLMSSPGGKKPRKSESLVDKSSPVAMLPLPDRTSVTSTTDVSHLQACDVPPSTSPDATKVTSTSDLAQAPLPESAPCCCQDAATPCQTRPDFSVLKEVQIREDCRSLKRPVEIAKPWKRRRKHSREKKEEDRPSFQQNQPNYVITGTSSDLSVLRLKKFELLKSAKCEKT